MSRDQAAKRLAAATGKRYVQALREVRAERDLCMTTKHVDAPCGPHCILAENVTRRKGAVDHALTGESVTQTGEGEL